MNLPSPAVNATILPLTAFVFRHTLKYLYLLNYLLNVFVNSDNRAAWFLLSLLCCLESSTPLSSTWPHLNSDVGLDWRKVNINRTVSVL